MDEHTNLNQLASAVVKRTNQLHTLSERFHGREETNEETGEITRHPGVKLLYEEALAEELLEVVKPFMDEGKRPPAEDIRTALARQHLKLRKPDLYEEYFILDGMIRRIERHLRNYSEAIRARQSVAKSERELAGHVPPSNGQTYGGRR